MNKPLMLTMGGILVGSLVCSPVLSAKPGRGKASTSAEKSLRQPIVLEALSLDMSGTPRLVLKTNTSPSFSSYSPQPEVFVVDLPQTSRGAAISALENLPPFIASITAEEAVELGAALTRVTIRFTQPVISQTSASADGVIVSFDQPATAAADLPVPAASKVDTPAAPAAVLEPVIAPEIADVPAVAVTEINQPEVDVRPLAPQKRATVLRAVETSGSGPTLRVTLVTNGAAEYTTFKLPNPLRLVVDLKGVKSKVAKPTINLGDPFVKRIRVGLFKNEPEPVTRVVLDLDEAVDYTHAIGQDAVLIAFGGDLAAPSVQASSESVEPVAVATVTKMPAKTEPAPVVRENVFEETPEPAVAKKQDRRKIEMNGRRSSESLVVRSPAQERAPRTPAPPPTPQADDVFNQPQEAPVISGSSIMGPGGSRTLSAGERVYTGEPIDLSLKDADIKDVLRLFAQLTGLNIAIDPQVAGTVTVQFENVPWDQALEIILRQNGLTYVLSGNVMRVGTIDRLSAEAVQTRRLEEEDRLNVPTKTVIKHLSYARATEVQSLLGNLASPKGRIIVDPRTNQLIITEVPEYLTTMLNLIDTVDIPTPQVVIEARIVETTKNFAQQIGVEWGFTGALDPALGTGTGLQFPNRVGVVGGPFQFGAGRPVLSLTFADVLGAFDLDLALTAAESEGLARIVSAPRVTTQDNQAAEIQSGVQIPVQTRVNFTTTINYVDATLRLSVTPQITSQDTVIMDISVQKTEPATGLSVVGGSNTPLLTRRATTRLMVRDGGTTVIGGIYQATENRAQSRVPYLHQIPVLGNLFKNRGFDSRHDELLIFITPRIVRNT